MNFFSIGEALIDMIPNKNGVLLKEVTSFTRTAGGAPANVCACVAKQGLNAHFIGKLGADAFGDFLIDQMIKAGVGTEHVFRTSKANTALAFVSLKADGDRDFSFYRNPGADMLLDKNEIDKSWFNKGDFLHFCSLGLVESPAKYAHKKAVKLVKNKGGTVVFDPNLRLPLWNNMSELKNVVLEYIKYSDIVKISDNEIEFLFGTTDVTQAANSVLSMGARAFVLTLGSGGARLVTKAVDVFCPAFSVKAIDSTGAGDAFNGGLISFMIKNNLNIGMVSGKTAYEMLQYANACGAILVTKHGAIESMPSEKQVRQFLADNK